MKISVSLLSALASIVFSVGASAGTTEPDPAKWKLAWSEDFNTAVLDTAVWSKCDRGNPDWCNTMSHDDSLFELRDGNLVLKGIVNPDTSADPSPYLTGGVWTKGRKAFEPGSRLEIRARLHGAKGAWPAIWLLPSDPAAQWPHGGEIDIMERLNNNHIVYQTVHSNYTHHKGNTKNPPSGATFSIDREGWNVYGVEIHPDKIQFFINGKPTLTYPKVNDGADGQFPFYIPQFLLIDMQLGGAWVGEVDLNDLPVEMEVDWVKYYTPVK